MTRIKLSLKPSVTDLLTVGDVAEKLKVTVRQIWRLHNERRLPGPLHIGKGSTRWRVGDIDRWIKAGCPRHE